MLGTDGVAGERTDRQCVAVVLYKDSSSALSEAVFQTQTSTLITPHSLPKISISKMLSKILFGLIAAKAAIASPIVEPVVDFTPDTLAEAQELAKFLQDIQDQSECLQQPDDYGIH